MSFILSSESLFACQNSNYFVKSIDSSLRFTITLSTQFSLPFKHIDPSYRYRWLLYRYSHFRKSIFESLCSQHLTSNILNVVWLVFISKGDRAALSLSPVESLPNGILLLWIEISPVINADDDYYRNRVMASINRSSASFVSLLNHPPVYNIFARVDSDDFISSDYFLTIIGCVNQAYKKHISTFYFSFPCGLFYDVKAKSIGSYVWPESPFLVYCTNDSDSFHGNVWKYPHDKVSHHHLNRQVITTKPMWCISVNHGNMANSIPSYFDINDPVDIPDIISHL